jgi:hypothetical protein
MLWVDGDNGSPTGPIVFDTIQGAIDAGAGMAPTPVVVLIKPGLYIEDLVLVDGVILTASTESLTYKTILQGTITYAGSTETSIIGLHLVHTSSSSLVYVSSSCLLRLYNCSFQNNGDAPVVELDHASAQLSATSCVLRADGLSTGAAAVYVQQGHFQGFGTNVHAPLTERSCLVLSSSRLDLFGPSTVEGQVSFQNGSATEDCTLSEVNIRSGALVCVEKSLSAKLLVMTLVGCTTTASVAIDNDGPVAYAQVGYGGTGMGFSNPLPSPLAIPIPLEGADNTKYDKTRVTLSPLAATNVQGAIDELTERLPVYALVNPDGTVQGKSPSVTVVRMSVGRYVFTVAPGQFTPDVPGVPMYMPVGVPCYVSAHGFNGTTSCDVTFRNTLTNALQDTLFHFLMSPVEK